MPGVIRTLVVLLLLFVCFQRKARNVGFHVKIPILNYCAGITQNIHVQNLDYVTGLKFL